MKPSDSAVSSPKPVSRRRAVRLDAPSALGVMFTDHGIVSKVLDIGMGGLGLRSNCPLGTGTTYEVTLMLGGRLLTCGVQVAHCQFLDTGHWLAGLAFVRDHRRADIESFVEAVMSSQLDIG